MSSLVRVRGKTREWDGEKFRRDYRGWYMLLIGKMAIRTTLFLGVAVVFCMVLLVNDPSLGDKCISRITLLFCDWRITTAKKSEPTVVSEYKSICADDYSELLDMKYGEEYHVIYYWYEKDAMCLWIRGEGGIEGIVERSGNIISVNGEKRL